MTRLPDFGVFMTRAELLRRALTDTPLIHGPRMFYSTRTPIRRGDHPEYTGELRL